MMFERVHFEPSNNGVPMDATIATALNDAVAERERAEAKEMRKHEKDQQRAALLAAAGFVSGALSAWAEGEAKAGRVADARRLNALAHLLRRALDGQQPLFPDDAGGTFSPLYVRQGESADAPNADEKEAETWTAR